MYVFQQTTFSFQTKTTISMSMTQFLQQIEKLPNQLFHKLVELFHCFVSTVYYGASRGRVPSFCNSRRGKYFWNVPIANCLRFSSFFWYSLLFDFNGLRFVCELVLKSRKGFRLSIFGIGLF